MECTLPTVKKYECDYVRQETKFLLLRKKGDELQVKINGKGKWINASYNEETKMISYLN